MSEPESEAKKSTEQSTVPGCPQAFTNADIQNLIRIMQGSAQHGVFDIREYVDIGTLFQKLEKAFLKEKSENNDKCPFGFNSSDIAIFVRIIDLAAKKGLFTGNDLQIVGSLYNRLSQQ
jgi:hypothetical protein